MSKIGILDPEAKFNNPLTNEPYKNLYDDPSKPKSEYVGKYIDFAKFWSNLPMYKQKTKEILKALKDNQVVLITAGTGAGKTVLLPKYLLHILNYDKKIAVTNPKKIPSEENANYAAIHLDVKLGEEVGIRYRGKKLDSDKTKLLYCTDGYLVATLNSDPLLSKFSGVIIDEAHERNNNIDLLLILLKQVLLKRDDFKLVIMSATINAKLFIDYFPKKKFKFSHVHSEGTQLFPVKEYFIEESVNKFDNRGNLKNKLYIKAAIKILNKILNTTEEGAILIFMPSKADLIQGCLTLELDMKQKNIFCQPLSGSSLSTEKEYAISVDKYKSHPKGPYKRKVVIGTEVVESSITIKGLKYVIDTGLSNQTKYYVKEGQNALEKKYISKASHLQRKGRVGRKSAGVCYNVFTKQEYDKLFPDYTISPILQSNIAQIVLSNLTGNYVNSVILPFNYKNAKEFDPNKKINLATFFNLFIEKPKEEYVNEALRKLRALGAISKNGKVTNRGYGMNKLNLEPEYSRMLIASYNYNVVDEISVLCAMLEIGKMSNFLSDLSSKEKKKIEKVILFDELRNSLKSDSDHISLINIYKKYNEQENKSEFCRKYYLNKNNFSKIGSLAKEFKYQIDRLVKRESNYSKSKYLYTDKIEFKDSSEKVRILAAIAEGLFINLFVKQNKKEYINCFPEKREIGNLERRSLLNTKIDIGVYTQFEAIFGKALFNMVSKLPNEIVDYLKKNKLKYIGKCL